MSDNQNHVRPPRRSTAKESRKSPTEWSATKYCTRHQQLGCCTRHMNKTIGEEETGKGKPVNKLPREEKHKHYLALIKKIKICVCDFRHIQ